MELYRRLPCGWRTTPEGIPTDWYMWHQMLSLDSCRAVTGRSPTVIGFAQAFRTDWSFERRQLELLSWEKFSQAPNAALKLAEIMLKWLLIRRAELEREYIDQDHWNRWLEKERLAWEHQAKAAVVEMMQLAAALKEAQAGNSWIEKERLVWEHQAKAASVEITLLVAALKEAQAGNRLG